MLVRHPRSRVLYSGAGVVGPLRVAPNVGLAILPVRPHSRQDVIVRKRLVWIVAVAVAKLSATATSLGAVTVPLPLVQTILTPKFA